MLMWAIISSPDDSSPQINKAVFRRVANKLNKFSRYPHWSSVQRQWLSKILSVFRRSSKSLQTSKSFEEAERTFYDILEILPALLKVMLEIKTSCGTIDINRIFTTKRVAREECCAIASVMVGKSSWENSSILHLVFFSCSFHHQTMYFFFKTYWAWLCRQHKASDTWGKIKPKARQLCMNDVAKILFGERKLQEPQKVAKRTFLAPAIERKITLRKLFSLFADERMTKRC